MGEILKGQAKVKTSIIFKNACVWIHDLAGDINDSVPQQAVGTEAGLCPLLTDECWNPATAVQSCPPDGAVPPEFNLETLSQVPLRPSIM